jgi:hypothetical protein
MKRLTREQREAREERAIKRDELLRRFATMFSQVQPGIVFLATQEELTGGASHRWRDVLAELDRALKQAEEF